VKSVDFLLQQDHPLSASWNTGSPGWNWQASTNNKTKEVNKICLTHK
jgi:hypothetical protein